MQGLDAEARDSVWPYLLQVLKPEWTKDVVEAHCTALDCDYNDLQGKCEVSLEDPLQARASLWDII